MYRICTQSYLVLRATPLRLRGVVRETKSYSMKIIFHSYALYYEWKVIPGYTGYSSYHR